MKLVLDANVLVAAFLRSAVTRELLLDERLMLVMPEYALVESEKVLSTQRLRKRMGNLSPAEVRWLLGQITAKVQLLPYASYQHRLAEAEKFAPHSEDSPYLALSLQLRIPLWSNDADLKNQSRVVVYTTRELLEILTAR